LKRWEKFVSYIWGPGGQWAVVSFIYILCRYWVGGVGKATWSAIHVCASVNGRASIMICVRVSSNMCASMNMRASRWGAWSARLFNTAGSSLVRPRGGNYRSTELPNYRTVELSTELRIGFDHPRCILLSRTIRCYVTTSVRTKRHYVTSSLRTKRHNVTELYKTKRDVTTSLRLGTMLHYVITSRNYASLRHYELYVIIKIEY